MKKTILSCLMALLLLGACNGQKVSSFSSVSQHIAFKKNALISFDGTAYLFAYGTPTLNEFVPRGEDISDWQNLLAIELYPEYQSVNEPVDALMFELDNEGVEYRVLENSSLGMMSIDYLIENRDEVELNVWKFEKPQNWRGIIGHRMAKKFPKEDGIAQGLENDTYHVQQFLRTKTSGFIH